MYAAAESSLVKLGNGHVEWRATGPLIRVFATCGQCKQPCMFIVRPKEKHEGVPFTNDIYSHVRFLNRISPVASLFDNKIPKSKSPAYVVDGREPGEVLNHIYIIEGQFPDSTLQRPQNDYLSESIIDGLNELEKVLSSPRHTVIECRCIIEQACREKLGETGNEKNLCKLIDAVLNNLEITRDLSSWAHALRHIANEVVHNDGPPPSEAEAQQVCELVKFLLDLLFVAPSRVKELRD